MISFSGVAKRYGPVWALRGVSFSVPKKRIVGLLGQNGAGKTTALNILTGCSPSSKGCVQIGGFDIRDKPRDAKRLMGYLPEKPPLYDEMTVYRYLRFVCELKEVSKRSIRAHIDEIIALTGLEEMCYRRIAVLSKGYRQRVGIAQSLCGAPEVLVLDEPTIGLDPRQITEIRALISKLGQTHTVLFSSHILTEVQQLCQRVIILHQGLKVLESDMCDLDDNPGCKRLRVVAGIHQSALLPAVRGLECVVQTELAAAADRETEMILTVRRDMQPERKLFTLLAGLDAPILSLAPVRDTLEDVFLRVTSGEETVQEGDAR
jgi:ABC-2 type transport system ATP-binding protein